MVKSIDVLSSPTYGLVKEVRVNQLKMAGAIEDSLKNPKSRTIIEAPVGCGKTYAYLIPAIFSEKRIVVSTAKKTLQDQIINKDIPEISKALNKGIKVAIAKGKGSYACAQAIEHKGFLDAKYLGWSKTSKTAEITEYPGVLPDWYMAATAERCSGGICKYYNSCGFISSRKKIEDAQIVVTNHTLLGHELQREFPTFFGDSYSVLIIDEAHQLVSSLRSSMSLTLNESYIDNVISELRSGGILINGLSGLKKACSRLFTYLLLDKPPTETIWTLKAPVFNDSDINLWFEAEETVRKEIISALNKYGVSGTASLDFWKSFASLDSSLSQWDKKEIINLIFCFDRLIKASEAIGNSQGLPLKLASTTATTEERAQIDKYNDTLQKNVVIYAKQDSKLIDLVITPVNPGLLIKERVSKIPHVVLTSATIAVNNTFDTLEECSGIQAESKLVLPPVFDYKKQTLLYIPRTTTPSTFGIEQEKYLAEVSKEVQVLVEKSLGNAFILFTSQTELEKVSSVVVPKLAANGIKSFVQGKDGLPSFVLSRYMETPNSVLFGLKSFWEGVDIPGQKLRLVIITKLPFPFEKDPLVSARKEAAGSNAFNKVNYADMIIDLKQGTGRLIRTATDRGVVAILDNRIWTKQYGGKVLSDLPFVQRTSDASLVHNYLKLLVNHDNNQTKSRG